jgi:SAM-dependent methyltransferase
MVRRILRRLVPRSVRNRLADLTRDNSAPATATFPDLAYLPYAPGENGYVLPLPTRTGRDAALPEPPQHLRLGLGSHEHGPRLTANMLDIVERSGFSFAGRGRILDFGCGDGRMIRHLSHLVDRWEIWGTDISSEHIYWCSDNLSPPFNFLVNTKTPHLPFKDGSFDFIFCGSLFTHVDDLAKAWLLELHRLLSPGGRAYVTIHDKHTQMLFSRLGAAALPTIAYLATQEVYRDAPASFGMMTVGRDHLSHVFYDVDFFARMAAPAFEVVSVDEEAFNLQTAVVLKPAAVRSLD